MNKNIWIAIVVIILLAGGWYYYGQNTKPTPTTGEVIKIGAVLGLTGDAAADSQNIQRGLDLAKEDLAKRGISVEINYQDDETQPAKSVLALQNMISLNKPQAIIGPVWSFLLSSAAPVIGQNKIPSFSPANTSEFVEGINEYIFFGAVKNVNKQAPLTEWLKKNNKRAVAVIVDNGAWGNSHLAPYKQAAEDAGAKVVLVEQVQFGSEIGSFPTVLAKAKAAKADVIVWTGFDAGAAILIKKSQELKLGIPIIGTNALETVVRKGLVTLGDGDQIFVFNTKINSKFVSKFEEKYREKPGTYTDVAYDGLMILVEAIKNTDGTGEQVANYLKTKTNYRGYANDYQFDSKGDIKGGEWILEQLKVSK